jgi:hypothetical protein
VRVNALMGGISAGDADDSYDFTAIGTFVAKLHEGYDLGIGNPLDMSPCWSGSFIL